MVATKVYAGTITSSPGPTPRAPSEVISALVPLVTDRQCFAPRVLAQVSSKRLATLPPSLFQRPPAQPEQVGPEGGGHERNLVLARRDFAPLNEDLFVQRDPDGLAGLGLDRLRLDVEGLHGLDVGGLVGRGED